MSEPRIIKYESDKYIEKGDYMGAVFESLKESGILKTIKTNSLQKKLEEYGYNFKEIK